MTYEQSIGRKDHVVANLTRALQKQVGCLSTVSCNIPPSCCGGGGGGGGGEKVKGGRAKREKGGKGREGEGGSGGRGPGDTRSEVLTRLSFG